MFLTGFTDEASAKFAEQVAITKELGWKFIEARNLDGKLLGTMDDAQFAEVERLLAENDVKINCYGSALANWASSAREEADFERNRQELLTAIPRMQKLGIKMLRGMSYVVPKDEPVISPALERLAFEKVKQLVEICADNGIIYGHENCNNIAGASYEHTLRLLEFVNNPALKLIFDTGNPCFNLRRIGPQQYWTLQSSYEFYQRVRPYICYVHIKDAVSYQKEDGTFTPEYTFAGDGCGDVRAILIDLLKTGYDGGFSMEPHLGAVYHDAKSSDNDPEVLKFRRDIYIEYCRRFEKLLRECGWKF